MNNLIKLKERIFKKYGLLNPIFLTDLKEDFKDIDGDTINKLILLHGLRQFDEETFYFTQPSILGGEIPLSSWEVAHYKYIGRGANIIGFYSGLTFENQIHLSTQVPSVLIITTNKVKEEIKMNVGSARVWLCPCKFEINKDNHKELQILTFMEKYQERNGNFEKEELHTITEYLSRTFEDVTLLKQLSRNFSKETNIALNKTLKNYKNLAAQDLKEM